jgi:hypothetical protein
MNKEIPKIIVYAILFLIVAEGSVRMMGLADVPIYLKDPDIGYIQQPNQSGSFLNRNAWHFNELCMNAGKFIPDRKVEVLLTGDSVVYGGNPITDDDRLGHQLELQSGAWAVWPVSVGGWSALNAMGYLKHYDPLFRYMKVLIWEINTGDFQKLETLQSSVEFPLEKPRFVLWYGFRKYIWGKYVEPKIQLWWPWKPKNIPPMDAHFDEVFNYLHDLHARYPNLVRVIVWYPNQNDLSKNPTKLWISLTDRMRNACAKDHIILIEVARDPRWTSKDYRDFIHPNAKGNKLLANVILTQLRGGHP